MMEFKFTVRNAVIASVIYQIYPIVLCYLALKANPNSKMLGLVGIFMISELVLACSLFVWKKKSENGIRDEREVEIRYKVNNYILRVVEGLFVLLVILSFYKEMSAQAILGIMAFPLIIGEVIANFKYRRL